MDVEQLKADMRIDENIAINRLQMFMGLKYGVLFLGNLYYLTMKMKITSEEGTISLPVRSYVKYDMLAMGILSKYKIDNFITKLAPTGIIAKTTIGRSGEQKVMVEIKPMLIYYLFRSFSEDLERRLQFVDVYGIVTGNPKQL